MCEVCIVYWVGWRNGIPQEARTRVRVTASDLCETWTVNSFQASYIPGRANCMSTHLC